MPNDECANAAPDRDCDNSEVSGVREEGKRAQTPYARFANAELILRDELAIDRTVLANERTLLAYLRSGVALMIAGASVMHFSEHGWYWLSGIIAIPAGVVTSLFGVWRFVRMKRSMAHTRQAQAD